MGFDFLSLQQLGLLTRNDIMCKGSIHESYCCREAWVAAGAGGVTALVATPLVLGAAGFTAGGVAAGSLAAKAMSVAATTGVGGGVVAALQSAGAAGLGYVGTAVVGTAGAATGYKVVEASGVCDGPKC